MENVSGSKTNTTVSSDIGKSEAALSSIEGNPHQTHLSSKHNSPTFKSYTLITLAEKKPLELLQKTQISTTSKNDPKSKQEKIEFSLASNQTKVPVLTQSPKDRESAEETNRLLKENPQFYGFDNPAITELETADLAHKINEVLHLQEMSPESRKNFFKKLSPEQQQGLKELQRIVDQKDETDLADSKESTIQTTLNAPKEQENKSQTTFDPLIGLLELASRKYKRNREDIKKISARIEQGVVREEIGPLLNDLLQKVSECSSSPHYCQSTQETLSYITKKLSLDHDDLLISFARTHSAMAKLLSSTEYLKDGIQENNINLLHLYAASRHDFFPLNESIEIEESGRTTVFEALLKKGHSNVMYELLSSNKLLNQRFPVAKKKDSQKMDDETTDSQKMDDETTRLLDSLQYHPNYLKYPLDFELLTKNIPDIEAEAKAEAEYKKLWDFLEKVSENDVERDDLLKELQPFEKLFLNYPYNPNKSFLYLAIERNLFECVKWIIEISPETVQFQTNYYQDNILYTAIRQGNVKIFTLIYTQCEKNTTTDTTADSTTSIKTDKTIRKTLSKTIRYLPTPLEEYAIKHAQIDILESIRQHK